MNEQAGEYFGRPAFVGVLGNRNSGKSTTWNTLFGATVRTGQYPRNLKLYGEDCVKVFLVSGSFEERNLYAGEILDNQSCRIILCSAQYTEEVRKTLNYIMGNKFEIFVQWLNPGQSDPGECYDRLGLLAWLIGHEATVSMRDGKGPPQQRTEEIRQFIHGWAKARSLTFFCPNLRNAGYLAVQWAALIARGVVLDRIDVDHELSTTIRARS